MDGCDDAPGQPRTGHADSDRRWLTRRGSRPGRARHARLQACCRHDPMGQGPVRGPGASAPGPGNPPDAPLRGNGRVAGYQFLYLYTGRGSPAQVLYERLNWRAIHTGRYDGIDVTVMCTAMRPDSYQQPGGSLTR